MKRDLALDLFRLRKKHRAMPRQAGAPVPKDDLRAPGFTVRDD
jgi:hypothetical protein